MLKIKFWRIENVIVMKILEQGDEIKRGCGEFFKHEGIGIRSGAYPHLYSNEISVYGTDSGCANKYVSISYDNTDRAKEILQKYVDAIKAYNASLGKTESEDDIETVVAE